MWFDSLCLCGFLLICIFFQGDREQWWWLEGVSCKGGTAEGDGARECAVQAVTAVTWDCLHLRDS